MKNNQNEVKKTTKNPTTNYPFDTHKAFCKRCLKQHGKCPVTKSGTLAQDCSL